MPDSLDLDVPPFDDAALDVMLRRTLARSATIREARAGRLAGTVVLVVLVAVVAGLVALPGRTTGPGTSHGTPSSSGEGWRLVDDVTEVTSWGTVTPNGFQPSLDLVCPAVGTCYADANGQIEFTHDGGKSWQQASVVNTAPMKGEISCVDARHCSVLGTATGGGSAFFTTVDGGAHWTSTPGPQQISSAGIGTKLSCVSATTCVVIEVDGGQHGSTVQISEDHPALVLTTSDSGATWSQSSEPPAAVAPMDFSCQASGMCMVSGLAAAYGTTADTTYVSNDAGATWAAAALPSATGPLMSVSCPTASRCLATSLDANDPGGGDVLLASSDGGKSWSGQTVSGLADSVLDTVSCPTLSECWLGGVARRAGASGAVVIGPAGQGLLSSSGDGGRTWQQATIPAGVGPVLDVTCPASGTCYALGVEPSSSGQDTGSGSPVVLLSTGS